MNVGMTKTSFGATIKADDATKKEFKKMLAKDPQSLKGLPSAKAAFEIATAADPNGVLTIKNFRNTTKNFLQEGDSYFTLSYTNSEAPDEKIELPGKFSKDFLKLNNTLKDFLVGAHAQLGAMFARGDGITETTQSVNSAIDSL